MTSFLVSFMIVLASAIVGFALALFIVWRLVARVVTKLGRDDRVTFELWAALHRWFSQVSGYDAIALTNNGGRAVFSLESIAWAIDTRDLLTHEPVSVAPSSEPPAADTEGACDGNA